MIVYSICDGDFLKCLFVYGGYQQTRWLIHVNYLLPFQIVYIRNAFFRTDLRKVKKTCNFQALMLNNFVKAIALLFRIKIFNLKENREFSDERNILGSWKVSYNKMRIMLNLSFVVVVVAAVVFFCALLWRGIFIWWKLMPLCVYQVCYVAFITGFVFKYKKVVFIYIVLYHVFVWNIGGIFNFDFFHFGTLYSYIKFLLSL